MARARARLSEKVAASSPGKKTRTVFFTLSLFCATPSVGERLCVRATAGLSAQVAARAVERQCCGAAAAAAACLHAGPVWVSAVTRENVEDLSKERVRRIQSSGALTHAEEAPTAVCPQQVAPGRCTRVATGR